MTRPQAYLHAILDVILRHTDEGRRSYSRDGERLVAGDILRLPELADTIDRIGAEGAGVLHGGELGRALVEHVQAAGGEITMDDLTAFRVIRRRPVVVPYRGHVFASNPPPSSGGVLIGYALRLLDELDADDGPGSAGAMAALAEVMAEQARVRRETWWRELYRGGLAKRLASRRRCAPGSSGSAHTPAVAEPPTPRGTTHISVVDADGTAAALTVSTGSGSGVIVPGTGIHVNNMLGEFDLPRPPRPGARLSSMMSPSVVLHGDRPRLVVGSAGSLRLRSAVLQVVVNVVGHGLGVEEALDRPRVHLEEEHLHCEGGNDPDELDRLEALGYDVVRWRRQNLYFGGAAAVEYRDDGTLAAAGDPRRGGHGIVV